MSAHTPGPWAIAPCSDTDETRDIVADYREEGNNKIAHWIAELDSGTDSTMDESEYLSAMLVMEANARLIAAAPDLLEALRAFVDRYVELVNCGDCGHWNPEEETEVITARAAIAKAEGREP